MTGGGGRAVADAQLRREIALYERARLRAGDGTEAGACETQLSSLWAELLTTSSRSAGDRGCLASVAQIGPR